jgi:hypothetical protein
MNHGCHKNLATTLKYIKPNVDAMQKEFEEANANNQ